MKVHSEQMTWGWSPRGPMQAYQGGARGTPAEAAQTKAWPSYEAEYLKSRLQGVGGKPSGKYNTGDLKDGAEAIYLDKVTEHFKDEADECLKSEFKDWLEGRHEVNRAPQPYTNELGAPVRRYTYHTDIPLNSGGVEQKAPGDPMEDGQWNPTWWGTDSLTHLPGVRDFLRGERKDGWENDFQMNMLAEHGPQDVEQAWQYFKHWVKKRPVSDSQCAPWGDAEDIYKAPEIQNAGRVGTMPHHMRARPSIARQDPPKEADVRDAATAAAAAATAAENVSLGAGAAAAAAANFDRAESLAQNVIRGLNGEAPIPMDDDDDDDDDDDWSDDDESMSTVDAAPRGEKRDRRRRAREEPAKKKQAPPRSYADFPDMPSYQGQKRPNPDDIAGLPTGRRTKRDRN